MSDGSAKPSLTLPALTAKGCAMRRFVYVSVIAALLAATWIPFTDACGWRRRACQCWYAVPAAQMPQMRVLATEAVQYPSGRIHRFHTIDDVGWQEPLTEKAESAEVLTAAAGEIFNGNDREAAKTSVSTATTTAFPDLAGLVATLPADDFMRQDHVPPISKARPQAG